VFWCQKGCDFSRGRGSESTFEVFIISNNLISEIILLFIEKKQTICAR
jgi:hypothetical protein